MDVFESRSLARSANTVPAINVASCLTIVVDVSIVAPRRRAPSRQQEVLS